MSDEAPTEERTPGASVAGESGEGRPVVGEPVAGEPVAGEPVDGAEQRIAQEPADGTEALEEPGRSFWVELPILILLAFALALFLKQFVVQAFYIPSESMLPTLQVNDRLLVDKLVYRFREPRRGEIIVFIAEAGEEKSLWQRARSILLEGFGVQRPGDIDFVKRIIGLPGETVEIVDGTVFITPPNGRRFALDEPYIAFPDRDRFEPTLVPEGHFFVLGDNRGASSDSRVRGPIPRDDIVGRARLRIWPVGRFGRFPTPAYATTTPDPSPSPG